MTCFHPSVAAWYKPEYQASRPGSLSKPLFLGLFRGLDVDYTASITLPAWITDKLTLYQLPCGKCEGCRVAQMQQWQFRAECELKNHADNAFITLTVDEPHMNEVFPFYMVRHRFFQLFMKKLRKGLKTTKIRYIMCAEYGTHTLRPHYHVIVFGWFPPDYQYFYTGKTGYTVYTSDCLNRLWTNSDGDSLGYHTVSVANSQTVRYLVGYVMKKSGSLYYPGFAPPYLRVSTRPAIGLDWYRKYGDSVFAHSGLNFPNDYVYLGRSKISVPRYYVKKFKENADNVDSVMLSNSRRTALMELPMLDICDLQYKEDYFKQRVKSSHNLRCTEV